MVKNAEFCIWFSKCKHLHLCGKEHFYQAGTIKMSDLLQAETLYQQSQDQYTDAYTDYQNKQVEYKQSAGIK